jgi:hypothetical protein
MTMKTGRVVLAVVGAVLALIGLSVVLAGAGLTFLHAQRDAEGYLDSPAFGLATDSYALATDEALLLEADPGTGRVPFLDRLDVRIEVERAEGEVFVGIAPAADLDTYLDGVAHDEVRRLGPGDRSRLTRVEGTRTPQPPADLDVWTASTAGAAPLTLHWQPEAGRWAGVIMNADGAAGIDVTIRGGVQTSALLPAGIALGLVGLVLLATGVVLVVVGLAGTTPPMRAVPPAVPAGAVPPAAAPAGAGGGPDRPYPLLLEASLDPALSRWRWLVKWLLLIPHVIVLILLWTAFAVLTVVAGVAILVTGRYPRAIFDFNVGVLRWSWRVSYYGYGALGTDRYPPFTLKPVADYPAHLDVAYPDRLSRGLVLVKWWLLAIPHYLIVAVLVGGGLTWTTTRAADEAWRLSLGGGLVGILLLIAAIALLFTTRYPPRLFDLVMGCQRWAYRVVAYAALMTDAYPPFRLDQGGHEPPVMAPPSPTPPTPPETAPPRQPVPH